MKIEVGKYYRRRDGEIEYIEEKTTDLHYQFIASGQLYTENGKAEDGFRHLDLINEVEVIDIKLPLEIKSGDYVLTDKGYEFGPVKVNSEGVVFAAMSWYTDGVVLGNFAASLGNIIEVTKRAKD